MVIIDLILETVQQAINRLKPKTVLKQSIKKKNVRKSTQQETIEKESKESSELNLENKENFEKIMNIVSNLTELSYFDVYSDTKSKIISELGPLKLIDWFYRIKMKNDDSETVYGPFTIPQIKEWEKQVFLK